MGDFVMSMYPKPAIPAISALPNETKAGLKTSTANLLTGKVSAKIHTPTRPINIPLVSFFT